MWLFVGLGNPGDEYARHRHNIGFMAVDAMAEDYGFPAFKKKYSGLLSEGRIGGEKVALLKPQTFMNLSGQSVVPAAQFYKIAPERIVIFHDELDLEAGKLRVKRGGGNAGHNGLESVQEQLGTPGFTRVRLGIGHPGDKARVHGYVLGNFSKADQDWLMPFIAAISRYAPFLMSSETDFMSKVAMEIQKEDGRGKKEV